MNTQEPADTLPIYSPTPTNAHPPSIMSSKQRMTVLDLTVSTTTDKPSGTTNPRNPPSSSPSRWRTPEFCLYFVVLVVVLPIMAWIPISLSLESHPNYPFYQSKLSSGWLFGRKMDNSDAQYRSFRGNLSYLIGAASLYLLLKFLRRRLIPSSSKGEGLLYTIPLNALISLVVVFVLHGASALKLLAILSLNYTIAKQCKGSKLGPLLTWLFNGAVLFANELNHGYRFGAISPSLGYLDDIEGLYPRWHVIFNITMLRLISFNMDYYWSHSHQDRTLANKVQTAPSDKQRQEIPHPDGVYSYVNYIAYVLYPPLYIAGPILTFNDFMWQLRRPINLGASDVRNYFVRFLVSFFTMEFILHFMYVVAIKDRKAWIGDTPLQISMIGFWNLMVVWLKLLIPWRFFRLWALADGIVAPENMVRCMANNYSTLGFWRSWHRSYNLWIIRYIYIPLGGSTNVILNTVLVFTFVALWHDLTFRLLAWGWLVSLFIVPELLATYLLPKSKFGKNAWYRHVCAIGAVANVLLMMAANLVGFVIGTDGIKFFVSQLLGTREGHQFLVVACACIFVGVQLMFEYREEEMRHGIYRRS